MARPVHPEVAGAEVVPPLGAPASGTARTGPDLEDENAGLFKQTVLTSSRDEHPAAALCATSES